LNRKPIRPLDFDRLRLHCATRATPKKDFDLLRSFETARCEDLDVSQFEVDLFAQFSP